MIVGTIVNNNGFMSVDVVKCFLALQGKYEVTIVEGPDVWANRNRIFNYAKKRGQALLSIDSDMIFTLEDVEKMEKHLEAKDVVAGLYVLGRPPYPPAVWKRVEKSIPAYPDGRAGVKVQGDYALTEVPNEMSEIGACAGGFMGISKKVVGKLEEPFTFLNEGDIQHDADTSFCHRAREAGYKIWLDPEIKLGHLRTKAIYANN